MLLSLQYRTTSHKISTSANARATNVNGSLINGPDNVTPHWTLLGGGTTLEEKKGLGKGGTQVVNPS